VAVLFTGALTFAIGIACVAIAIVRDRALDRKLAWVVVVALVVMAVSRIVPFAAIQFYVQSAAALIALWPLAWVMSTDNKHAASGRASRPAVRDALT
jgi:hypothetical protein